jgi:hypothetical protein
MNEGQLWYLPNYHLLLRLDCFDTGLRKEIYLDSVSIDIKRKRAASGSPDTARI